MNRLLVPLIGLGFLVGTSLSAQPEADRKLQAPEKGLTAEQKRLVDDYVNLRFREGVRYSTANEGVFPTLPAVRKDVMTEIDAIQASEVKKFWRDLPRKVKERFRNIDPQYVLSEERKAAERLPAEAKSEVAKLLSDDPDKVRTARRKILVFGPACRALIVDQMSGLASNSPKRLGHQDLLAKLDFDETWERRLRATETAQAKAAKLRKANKNQGSTIAVLMSRSLCDIGERHDLLNQMYHYNFVLGNYEYNAGGCALGFGSGGGTNIHVNFVGGQDNRLTCLGEVKYADVKKAPGPAETAKWWNEWKGGPPMTAVVGHTYLLHLLEQRDKIDFTVKFRVLDMSDDEWIIIEWQRIPQEK